MYLLNEAGEQLEIANEDIEQAAIEICNQKDLLFSGKINWRREFPIRIERFAENILDLNAIPITLKNINTVSRLIFVMLLLRANKNERRLQRFELERTMEL